MGYKVLCANTTRLLAQIKMAKVDGSAIKELQSVERQDLLILDDYGIQPLDQICRASLLEIIEDQHGKHATIIASQLSVKQWYEVIGEQAVADAVLVRIVHGDHRIDLKGKSLRRKWNKKNGRR